jgi:hypothetical protein
MVLHKPNWQPLGIEEVYTPAFPDGYVHTAAVPDGY